MTTADHRLVLLLTDSSDQGTYACKANNHGYGSVQTGPGINLTVQGMYTYSVLSRIFVTLGANRADTIQSKFEQTKKRAINNKKF